MFRGSQLLGKAKAVKSSEGEERPLPVALIVSDNPVEFATLRPVLEKARFRVVELGETSNVISVALKHSARLIVAVLNMAGENTYSLWQNLRERSEMVGTAYIFITPPGETADKLLAFESFASDYVQRPVDPSDFERRLNAVLRNSEIRSGKRPNTESLPPSSGHADFSQLRPLTPNWPRPGAGQDKDAFNPPARPIHASIRPRENPAEARTAPPALPPDDLRARLLGRFSSPVLPIDFDGVSAPTPSFREPSFPGRSSPAAPFQEPRRMPEPAPAQVRGPASAPPGFPDRPFGTAPRQTEIATPPAREVPPTAREAAAELYREAAAYVLASIRHAEAEKPIDVDRGMAIGGRLVASLREGNEILLLVTDRTVDFSLTQSSVNVAVLACRIAQTLGFPDERIVHIVMAGLLHDVGIVRLPRDFIHKVGDFSEAERTAVEQVPRHSAEILSNFPGFEWLPLLIGMTAERDASTAPKGKELGEDSSILGVATVFEACIHKRPNREAMTGYQALEALTTHSQGFPDRIVKAMIRSFSVYPYNEYVVLNTGEIGQVVDINTANPLRPTVRLLFSGDGEPIHEIKTLNLAHNSSIHVVRAITRKDLPA